MGLYRFEITEDHLNLLQNLDWEAAEDGNTGDFGIPYLRKEAPFGDMPTNEYLEEEEDDSLLYSEKVVKDAAIILYGSKGQEVISDPHQTEGPQYTKEEMDHARKMLSELYLALDIVTFMMEFKTGKFVTEHYQRNWREETE